MTCLDDYRPRVWRSQQAIVFLQPTIPGLSACTRRSNEILPNSCPGGDEGKFNNVYSSPLYMESCSSARARCTCTASSGGCARQMRHADSVRAGAAMLCGCINLAVFLRCGVWYHFGWICLSLFHGTVVGVIAVPLCVLWFWGLGRFCGGLDFFLRIAWEAAVVFCFLL